MIGIIICGDKWKSLSIPVGESKSFNLKKFSKLKDRKLIPYIEYNELNFVGSIKNVDQNYNSSFDVEFFDITMLVKKESLIKMKKVYILSINLFGGYR